MLFLIFAAVPLVGFASAGSVPLATTECVSQEYQPIAKNYVAMTAAQKLDSIWSKILATKNKKGNEPWEIEKIKMLWASYDQEAFTNSEDFMIKDRKKLIHFYQGSTIKLEWISTGDHNYTGLFETGTKEAIMRISQAKAPVNGKIIPGFAIKMLIDGKKSKNIFAMLSLDGQDTPGFFDHAFTNIVPPPTEPFPLQDAFSKAKENIGDKTSPLELHVKHIASIHTNGTEVSEPNAPFQLVFVPSKELTELTSKASFQSNTPKLIEGKGEGMELYTVYALKTATSHPKKIAVLKGLSPFVASQFGDDILYFQHHKAE